MWKCTVIAIYTELIVVACTSGWMCLHSQVCGMTTSLKTVRQCKLHWIHTVLLGGGLLAIQLSNYYVNVDCAHILFLSEEKNIHWKFAKPMQFPVVPERNKIVTRSRLWIQKFSHVGIIQVFVSHWFKLLWWQITSFILHIYPWDSVRTYDSGTIKCSTLQFSSAEQLRHFHDRQHWS